MQHGHDAHAERAEAVKERMAQIKHKVIVLSGKGGVGKSTVAVNLAMSLALSGKQVGLLDVDLHGPTVPQLLGLGRATPAVLGETLIPIDVGDNLKIMSIGFLLGDREDAVVWRGPMKANMIEQFLSDVDWGELDYLIIDSPPGTGDEPLAVCQAIGKMDGAVIVTTPQETALVNVRRSVRFCALLNLPVLGVIENMAGFVCPHCGEVTHVFSRGGGSSMAEKAGVPFLGSIPLDPAIVEAGDSGRPYVEAYPESVAAREFAQAILPILALDDGNGSGDAGVVDREVVKQEASGATAKAKKAGMRFAVPVTNDVLCLHFGHCEQFVLVDVDTATQEVTGMQSLTPPEHQPGLLPVWLSEQGIDFVIAGGMGGQAKQLLQQRGVEVLTGAPALEPETLVRQYLAGDLQTGENTCDH